MSTPAAYRRTCESLREAAMSLVGSWQQPALLLLSCWMAICPTAVLATTVSWQPASNSASPSAAGPSTAGPSAAGPSTAGPSAAVPVRDARLSAEPCQGSSCCCSAQACRCCNLEVIGAPAASIPTKGHDSLLGSDQIEPNTTPTAPGVATRDFEAALPRASLCDCGCQRPLTPPAAPGSANFSLLALLACRQSLQSVVSNGHTPLGSNPSASPTTLGSKLLALGGPTRRQAALHRWLI